MKKPREDLTEVGCPACDGTGFQKVEQPKEPGRRIYPAICKVCLGKGRVNKSQQRHVSHRFGATTISDDR